MKYHLNMKTKQCPHCPMVFVETKNLTRHLKTHVNPELQNPSFFHEYSFLNLYKLFDCFRRWKSHTHVQFVAEGSHTAIMFGHMNKRTPIEMCTGNSNAQ